MIPNEEAITKYIARYRHKARVLKQIHSILGARNLRFDTTYTVTIIVLTTILTFVGFIGTGRIVEVFELQDAAIQSPNQVANSSGKPDPIGPGKQMTDIQPVVSGQTSSDSSLATQNRSDHRTGTNSLSDAKRHETAMKGKVDIAFNIAVLIVFAASLLNLIYRWKERSTGHLQGVARLTQYVCWLDELNFLGPQRIDLEKLKAIRNRYQSIVEQLPPNSDKDYDKAIKSLTEKGKLPSSKEVQSMTHVKREDEDVAFLKDLIQHSPILMPVIRAISRVSQNLWLGGGPIRSYVWDTNQGAPAIFDFDVLYFDDTCLDESKEKGLEARIRRSLPNSFKVSVKNQARMHLVNQEPRRNSLEDSVANFPETATAVAARLNEAGELVLIAPYGVRDLLDRIIRPTPYHSEHPSAFIRRTTEKQWETRWGAEVQKPYSQTLSTTDGDDSPSIS